MPAQLKPKPLSQHWGAKGRLGKVLDFLFPQDPSQAAQGAVNPIGYALLPAEKAAAVAALAFHGKKPGKFLGMGSEAMASKLGKYVAKKPMTKMSAGGGRWRELVDIADKLPRFVPRTQYVEVAGKPRMIQEHVERIVPRGSDLRAAKNMEDAAFLSSNKRLRAPGDPFYRTAPKAVAVRRMLRQIQAVGGRVSEEELKQNLMLGKLRGRTRWWLPDVGALRWPPKPATIAQGELLPTSSDLVRAMTLRSRLK